ncbi:MAG: DMT family transporter [Synergistaceae bacterium]|nr:DMT family transporter [Synergistota bacterium]NLM71746.1 DMT family transporter [Synergistaceae bacterium]
MTEKPPVSPWIVLSIGVFAISTGAIFTRMASAPPLVISAYRVGLATLFLSPFTIRRAVAELSSLGRRDVLCGAASGLFLALHFAAWISSLFYTSVASSVVIVNAIPLWTGLFSPFLTGEPFSKALKRGLLIALPGALIISWGDFATGWAALWGDFLALLGSLFAALYILLGRRIRPHVSLGTYVTLSYGVAAAVLWAAVLAAGLPVSGFSGTTWSALFLMALVPQVLGHSSYNWALRWMSGGTVSLCLLGEPVGSSILAALLLGEPLTLVKTVGGGLILAGIVLASREER